MTEIELLEQINFNLSQIYDILFTALVDDGIIQSILFCIIPILGACIAILFCFMFYIVRSRNGK